MTDSGDESSRRVFLRAAASTFLVLPTSAGIEPGYFQVEESDISSDNIKGIADIIGEESDRPEPGSDFFEDKEFFAYRFVATDSGARYLITHGDESWAQLFTDLVERTTDNLPDDPDSGTIYLDTTRRVIAWYDGNRYKWTTHSPDLKTTVTTVTGDQAETTVYQPDIESDVLDEERFHEIKLWGRYTTSTSSDFFTIRVKIAGTTVASLQSTTENVTDAPLVLATTIGVVDVGTTGTIEIFTSATFNNIDKDVSHGRKTLDTTTTSQLEITVEWDGSDSANSLEARLGKIQQDP